MSGGESLVFFQGFGAVGPGGLRMMPEMITQARAPSFMRWLVLRGPLHT